MARRFRFPSKGALCSARTTETDRFENVLFFPSKKGLERSALRLFSGVRARVRDPVKGGGRGGALSREESYFQTSKYMKIKRRGSWFALRVDPRASCFAAAPALCDRSTEASSVGATRIDGTRSSTRRGSARGSASWTNWSRFWKRTLASIAWPIAVLDERIGSAPAPKPRKDEMV